MRTITEYEPSDIKMTKEELGPDGHMDAIHAFLLGQIMVIGISGMKPRPGDPPDDTSWPIRRLIADFLNNAQKAGISIAVAEAVPNVFREDT